MHSHCEICKRDVVPQRRIGWGTLILCLICLLWLLAIPFYKKRCPLCGTPCHVPTQSRNSPALVVALILLIIVLAFTASREMSSLEAQSAQYTPSNPIADRPLATTSINTGQTDSDQVARNVAPIKIQWLKASQILTAYERNEVAADLALKGHLIAVRGHIDEIGKDILDLPFVILTDDSVAEEDYRKVQAYFSKDDESQLAGLSRGQTLTVACTVKGLMMNVQLNDCRIVDESTLGQNLVVRSDSSEPNERLAGTN